MSKQRSAYGKNDDDGQNFGKVSRETNLVEDERYQVVAVEKRCVVEMMQNSSRSTNNDVHLRKHVTLNGIVFPTNNKTWCNNINASKMDDSVGSTGRKVVMSSN
jgi:hypothetical protein